MAAEAAVVAAAAAAAATAATAASTAASGESVVDTLVRNASGIGLQYSVTDPPPLLVGLGWMFYIVPPADASFSHIEQVPDYIAMATPYFLTSILIELIVSFAKHRKSSLRINDSLSSLSAGIWSQVTKALLYPFDIAAYIWCYNNFCVYELPWDSPYTWWFGMLGVDFAYYWLHRAAHEINLLWAGHSVHHSSEEYNLTTALRQGVLQGPTVFCFYLPLALVLPPPILAVHKHFNTLYQFWIHTQMIKSLGPLEWILNTPSHHAVHHGRNRYCIDKNYGGTLIIWDRLFGTFQAEADPIVFGVTHPLSTWDPVYTQFAHIRHIFRKAWAIQGWRNKLAVFFYGPGWDIGKARTGDLNDIPDVRAPWPKYDRSLSAVMAGYVFVHFLLLVVALQLLTSNLLAYPVMVLLALYMLTTLSSFGALLDHKPMANGLELGRILSVLVLDTAIRGYLGRDTHAFFWLPRAQVSDTVQFQLEVLWTILLASAGFMVIQMAVSPSNASLTDKQQAKLREEAPVPSTSSTTPTPLGARRSQRTLSSR